MVLMKALDHQRKSLVLTLLKQIQNFVWILTIMLIIVNCLLMEKKSLNYKVHDKNINFPTQFCLQSISNGFSNAEAREVSLNENVYDFSVKCNSIDKSDMWNINKYLMRKNNIK